MADTCVDTLPSERSNNEVPRKKQEKSSCYKMNILLEKLPVLGEIFELHYKIGEGTFSNVYLASSKYRNEQGLKDQFAVKHLIPTCHPSRIVRELKCLQEIGGVDNVAGVVMCLRRNDCITFVMPYQPHDRFSSYVADMSVSETQMYLKQLLVALKRVHKFGVIHRDVKPSNFLYSRKENRFLLVDFGLAQKVGEWSTENGENLSSKNKKRKRVDEGENQEPGNEMPPVKRQALQNLSSNVPLVNKHSPSQLNQDLVKRVPLANRESNVTFVHTQQVKKTTDKLFARPMSTHLLNAGRCNCDGKPQICHKCLTRKAQSAPRAGTPGFRPPEVLLKYPHQTTAVDMWAVGVIMLCVLSRTYPFFRSPDDVTALAEMITLFGSEEIKNIANKLGRNIVCSETRKALDLKKLCVQLGERKGRREERFPDCAFSLMSKLLDLDPRTRITADEALKHPFITDEFNTPQYHHQSKALL